MNRPKGPIRMERVTHWHYTNRLHPAGQSQQGGNLVFGALVCVGQNAAEAMAPGCQQEVLDRGVNRRKLSCQLLTLRNPHAHNDQDWSFGQVFA